MNPFVTYIAGIKFNAGKDIIAILSIGSDLELIREPNNPHDSNAIAVYYGKYMLGHIPARDAARISNIIDSGSNIKAEIIRIGEENRVPTVSIRLSLFDPSIESKKSQSGCLGVMLLIVGLVLYGISAFSQ